MNSKVSGSLKIILLLSALALLFTVLQLSLSLIDQRPIWLIIIQIIPLPFLLFLVIILGLDLIKKDMVTIKGKLIHKRDYTVQISLENGEVKKYRLNKAIINDINNLEMQQEIQLQHYKRTKAVTYIYKTIAQQN